VLSKSHAALGFAEDEELATLLRDELETMLDELKPTLDETLEREETDEATEDKTADDTELELGVLDATELLELVGVVPQPIAWVDKTKSSIHTSAVLLLKLWKPIKA